MLISSWSERSERLIAAAACPGNPRGSASRTHALRAVERRLQLDGHGAGRVEPQSHGFVVSAGCVA